MLFGLFGKKQNRCLGIDFGASSIKIVELSRDEKNRLILSNYVIAQTKIGSSFSITKLNDESIIKILKELLNKAGISSSQAVISLSVGETFSTVIDLPNMSEQDLIKAIPYQAQKYVPVPIDEVVLDWSVVGGDQKKNQILIVAVPKDLIKKIAQIAKKVNLKILAIEQEAFSIVRSLVGNDQEPFLVIDLGQEEIDFILVDKNSIRFTCTFSVGKKPDLILETGKIIDLCQTSYGKKVAKIILTGGRAERGLNPAEAKSNDVQLGGVNQGNLVGILADRFKIPTGIGDPFARLTFEQKLAPALKEIAPFMAVAVGGAMREI